MYVFFLYLHLLINVDIKDVCREMLESKRLILSKPQLSFSEELYEIHSNKLATKYTPKRRYKTIEDTKKCSLLR